MGESDAAALRAVLATADRRDLSTGLRMPNAAPPLPPMARVRTATAPTPIPAARATSPVTAVATPPAVPALPGVPASWAGVGPLLAAVGERAPADALRLATGTSGDAGTGPAVDLSGMWVRPADPAAPRSNTLIRTLDAKGRLMLPLTLAAAAPAPAERDGAVLTVFLPGSPGRPRPGFAVAALPLDARGRLTRRGVVEGRFP